MNIKQKTISSMKGIALDAINKAGQGHIGMAIGAAPITYALIGESLNFSKQDPRWINRDRFVMSAGHGSMAYYSIMHYLGLLSVKDIKAHKELYSKTPSHPEIDAFKYVDASTGPLGQGVSMGVGMAISQKYLKNRYNKPGFNIFDHKTYVLVGDGCLQEGVALEAIQLAGTMQLKDLIIIQDFNNFQIDSKTSDVNSTDLKKHFKANKFDVIEVKTASAQNIMEAIKQAKLSSKPVFIQVHTIIAQDTPVANTSSGHNGVLSEINTNAFKAKIGLNKANPFKYDQDVYDHGQKLLKAKSKTYEKYQLMLKKYEMKFPQECKELMQLKKGNSNIKLNNIQFNETDVATRNYFVPIMTKLEESFNIIGGSADLAAATKIKFKTDLVKGGKNIKYGIREHAMVSINNGIYLHCNLRTIDATFLSFADYSKPAYRLGSIMEIPSLHVLTHDSYEVGGDGPTHQPFDQLGMLRLIDKSIVMRPSDETEMKLAFDHALANKTSQAFIIACRQPIKSNNKIEGSKLPKAYVVKASKTFDVSIIATGSEVSLAIKVADSLKDQGIKVQVISAPLLKELTEDDALIKKLKIDQKPIFGLEASNDNIWYRFAQFNKFACHLAAGYGYSAPGPEVYDVKGFNVKNISNKVLKLLK